jgi:hypothetical protein
MSLDVVISVVVVVVVVVVVIDLAYLCVVTQHNIT